MTKLKPRPCRQRGVCKYWDKCPFAHNERLCRIGGVTADGRLPLEVA